MIISSTILNKPLLIIGNSPTVKYYKYKELIEETFFIIRFKVEKAYRYDSADNLLEEFIGKKTDIWWEKKEVYTFSEQNISLNAWEIRNNFSRQYRSKPSRGMVAILLFLEFYKLAGINKSIYIHGFSHNNYNAYFKNHLNLSLDHITELINMNSNKLNDYNSVSDYLKHRKNHSCKHEDYDLEKLLVKDLINNKKIIILNDNIEIIKN
jgi:hypothetical protein